MAVTWNANYELTPLPQDSPTGIDDEVRGLKDSISARMKNEHETFETDNSSGAEGEDFVHKAGSAKAFIGDYGGFSALSLPTKRPDGVTDLDTEDAGRTAIDTNGGTYQQYVWSGSAWVGLGGLPINSLYIQLAGMAAPSTIFPGTWTNISSTYAGRFFRAEGGNAVAFSDTASLAQQADDNKPHTHSTTIQGVTGGDARFSGFYWRDRWEAAADNPATFTSSTSGTTESRPINSTMRIWKRTA